MLKIVKKVVPPTKDGEKEKVFYNIYLFGVAIKTVNPCDYAKLYYQVKGHLANAKEEN